MTLRTLIAKAMVIVRHCPPNRDQAISIFPPEGSKCWNIEVFVDGDKVRCHLHDHQSLCGVDWFWCWLDDIKWHPWKNAVWVERCDAFFKRNGIDPTSQDWSIFEDRLQDMILENRRMATTLQSLKEGTRLM